MKASMYLLGLTLLGGAYSGPAARSQCLPLQALTKDVAGGVVSQQTLAASLPADEWQLHPAANGGTYWAYLAPATRDEAKKTPETRLELRRPNQQAVSDVVYKTASKGCFSGLRSELRRAKLKVEPVTCVQCEAERFTAPNYTVTIYDQQANFAAGKAPYPFVLIVHSLAGGATIPN